MIQAVPGVKSVEEDKRKFCQKSISYRKNDTMVDGIFYMKPTAVVYHRMVAVNDINISWSIRPMLAETTKSIYRFQQKTNMVNN